jgi:hypothetical protein
MRRMVSQYHSLRTEQGIFFWTIFLHSVCNKEISNALATNTGVPGAIPGVARFFWAAVGLERGPLSLVNNLRSYLEEIVAAPGLENRSYGWRDS